MARVADLGAGRNCGSRPSWEDAVGAQEWGENSGSRECGEETVGAKGVAYKQDRGGREVELSVEKTRCKFVSSR